LDRFSKEVIEKAVNFLGVPSPETIYVGTNPKTEIVVADEAHLIPVRLRKGDSRSEKPIESKGRHEIDKLSEILQLIESL
jgi:ribonucleotide monophosphatase NagD (HAD superfamily)